MNLILITLQLFKSLSALNDACLPNESFESWVLCYDRRSLCLGIKHCQTVAGLLMWGALSDQRTGLSFTVAAGPRQRSHSRVRVAWDSWPYFTVSYSRLPFSSPPTTHRATVEVFVPASTRENPWRVSMAPYIGYLASMEIHVNDSLSRKYV
jgi:hypothetical protein